MTTEYGDVWIDPETGLGWTVVDMDGGWVTLQAYVTQERLVEELPKDFRLAPHPESRRDEP